MVPNGLSASQPLTANMVLTIPNKVTNIHNNAGTFRPYDPSEAIGDVNPTLPTAPPVPRKKKKCGGLLQIVVAIVSVAVSVIAGPVAGNVVGQVLGMVTGQQKGFNFSSFALSFVPITPFNADAGGLQGILNAAGNAAVNNIASQGLNIITGQQKGFSWSGIAVAAVGGAVGNYVGSKFNIKDANGNLSKSQIITKNVISGMASSVASQLTQIAIDGRGQLNWASVAVGGIYGVGSGLKEFENENAKLIAEQREKQGNTTEFKDRLKQSVYDRVDDVVRDESSFKTASLSTDTILDIGKEGLTILDNVKPKFIEALDYIWHGDISDNGWIQTQLAKNENAATGLQVLRLAAQTMIEPISAVKEYGPEVLQSAWSEIKENALPIARDVIISAALAAFDLLNTPASPTPDTGIIALGMMANRLDKTLNFGGAFIDTYNTLKNFDISQAAKQAISQVDGFKEIQNRIANAKDSMMLKAIPGLEFKGTRDLFEMASNKIFKTVNTLIEKVGKNHPMVATFAGIVENVGHFGERVSAALLGYSGIVQADTVRGLQNNSGQGVDLFAKALIGTDAGKWIAFEIKSSRSSKAPALSPAQEKGAVWYAKDRLNTAIRGGARWVIDQSVDRGTVDYASQILSETGRGNLNGYVIYNNAVNTANPQTYVQQWNRGVKNPYKGK